LGEGLEGGVRAPVRKYEVKNNKKVYPVTIIVDGSMKLLNNVSVFSSELRIIGQARVCEGARREKCVGMYVRGCEEIYVKRWEGTYVRECEEKHLLGCQEGHM
jgi:hypothetical protein